MSTFTSLCLVICVCLCLLLYFFVCLLSHPLHFFTPSPSLHVSLLVPIHSYFYLHAVVSLPSRTTSLILLSLPRLYLIPSHQHNTTHHHSITLISYLSHSHSLIPPSATTVLVPSPHPNIPATPVTLSSLSLPHHSLIRLSLPLISNTPPVNLPSYLALFLTHLPAGPSTLSHSLLNHCPCPRTAQVGVTV